MVDICLTGLGRVDRQHNNVGTVEVGFGGAETLGGSRSAYAQTAQRSPGVQTVAATSQSGRFPAHASPAAPARMLIIGEVKIRHSGDMGSSSRRVALYHGFLEQTVTSVTVTSLLQRGYSGQRNVRECTGET